ncbi:DUF2721 domain-containing protein [Polymorphobacter arshaanensis]|uniref:DUF2721 domain-containing protein n=1 Tax=Glacieibacterium arshaanense TaxID=2511025 RepID=A0A4Y9EKI0_9SPHN|nr:DUF2721 domain-containing protein [Polymorphobacter arshaanensis]TFU01312.1 DUF2721 domain-containing protein [Polymorphobacter arshaanensis]
MIVEPVAVDNIAHNIQLAVAPVFLLTGIGSVLNVLTTRLGRVIDRARGIEAHFPEFGAEDRAIAIRELRVLDRRMATVHIAIALCTMSALLVCVLVSILFIGDFVPVPPSTTIAALFVVAMTLLIGGLVMFLREIRLATRSVRVNQALIGADPSQPGG